MRTRLLALVAATAAAIALSAPVVAGADDYTGTTTPTVLGEQIQRPTAAPFSTSRASLPVTGGDIAGLTAVGVGAIGLGTILVRRRRHIA
ncbi:MAG TPA: LPXTG cell wall anchor domain-containing protein [Acidimicrobiales bacterium]|nr:LPXTG cell wall anchor domain-containing protein [Acidimicrobiales bacterium]